MPRVYFCGQAPSRLGDGRPFNGPSGNRLAALMKLRDYEHLNRVASLTNIFDVPALRTTDRGDQFDRVAARDRADELVEAWLKVHHKTIVVACGHQVYRAFTGEKGTFYKGKRLNDQVEIWCFPHPSGASSYWNDPDNVLEASRFLLKLLKRSGLTIAR